MEKLIFIVEKIYKTGVVATLFAKVQKHCSHPFGDEGGGRVEGGDKHNPPKYGIIKDGWVAIFTRGR